MATTSYYSGGYENNMSLKLHRKQPTFFNSIFMSTVNMATKMLLSVASNNHMTAFDFDQRSGSVLNKWKAKDHLKFMFLIFSWFAMWAFRVVADFFPSLSPRVRTVLLCAPTDQVQQRCSVGGRGDGSFAVGSSSSTSLALLSASSPSLSSYSYSPVENLDLIPHDGFLMDGGDRVQDNGQSFEALGRALSHVLSLLNELPSTSRKYEFAMAMAEKILDDNTRGGQVELLQVNRIALSTAFERTTCLINRSLFNSHATDHDEVNTRTSGAWTTRVIGKLPLGSYITAYMKGGLRAVFPALDLMGPIQKKRRLLIGPIHDEEEYVGPNDHSLEVVGTEKLVQELLWITNKLRVCHAVDEALVQWSLASSLASLSLNANPRIQALLIRISASLIVDIGQTKFEVPTQVQYRLLVLWLPLFCYASNGLRYPVLSCYEKAEVERTMEQMITTLPAMEQEIVLRNWLQDFAICSSDWPNLRPSYDRWCQSSRQLVS